MRTEHALAGQAMEPLEPRRLLSTCGCSSATLPTDIVSEPVVVSGDELIASPLRQRVQGPGLRVKVASTIEGDTGESTAMTFVVRRTGAGPLGKASVRFSTALPSVGTAAVLGVDFLAATGRLRFKPGQRKANIHVTINGNDAADGNRTLAVELSKAKGTAIKRGTGIGVIVDDDSPGVDLQLLAQSLLSNVDNIITMQLTVRNNGGTASPAGNVLFVATATGFPGGDPPDSETEPGPVFRLLALYDLASVAPGQTVVDDFLFDTNPAIHCTDTGGRHDFGGYIELRATTDIDINNNSQEMIDEALLPDDDTNFSQGCNSGWMTVAP